jgi:glycosyltransferase involved in cell wall biosynthesis
VKLSVVITTRNEAENIGDCIRAFDGFRDEVEVIVVDNSSSDGTGVIAERLGAKVFVKGPERCAQRNFGCSMASSEWIFILDADMVVPSGLVREVLSATGSGRADAFWIPEVRTVRGIRTRARNFERSFYDGTVVDALRVMKKSVVDAAGGYDENLVAGGEDWDLDIRILALGARCEVLKTALLHNEKSLTLSKLLAKKAYYSKTIGDYRAKWPGHPAVRRQFSPWYRFAGVFVENGKWKRLVRHPVLAAVMYFERLAVALTYLFARRKAEKGSCR